jgi:hypothetical protein
MPLLALLSLAPSAALLLGALLTWHTPRPLLAWRLRLAVVASALALGAACALGISVWHATAEPLRLVLMPWFRVLAEEGPALQVDRLAAACLVLIAGLALVGALRGQASGDGRALAAPLLVSAGAAAFVALSDAPLGLVFGWLVLDVALLAVGETAPAVLLLNQFGLVMALAGLVGLPSEIAGGAHLGLGAIAAQNRPWMLGAAAVRMGLYPLWWSLPRTAPDRAWRACGLRLAPTVAGAYLVLRLSEGTQLGQGYNLRTLAPALVALLGGALLAWLAAHRSTSLDWQTTVHAALVVMAASVGGSFGQAVGLVLLVDLVVTRGALYASQGLAAGRSVALARWVIAAAAAGVPPTLGFAGRWLLYRELLASEMRTVLLLVVLGTALSTMALFEGLRVRAPVGRSGRVTVATVLGLSLAGMLLGVALPLLQPLVVAVTGTTIPSPLADLWATVTNPLTIASGLALVTAVFLPLVVGIAVRRTPNALSDTRRQLVRRVIELADVSDHGARAFLRAGEWVHRATGLLESHRAMAWTLMAAAVTGTAVIAGAGTPAGVPTVRDPGGTVLFLAASTIAGVMVLGASPLTALGALGCGYAFVFADLALVGGVLPLAFVKLLAGVLAIVILGISVIQAPDERHISGAARRLLALHGEGARQAQTGVVASALAITLVVAYGVRSVTFGDALPFGVLAPALALMGGGVLTAVFARDALRLATGVLLALVGFDLAYTPIDPGLLIAGALAAFQLLFAVVASFHVGLAATDEVHG